ncbi:dihydroxyacetone kinase subunit DhaK (plasmid) [Rhizobium indicum]|uniref:dihydroxyacetone kinase family protein n=1 Tax=Rhizobium indicum TaxID=2583231 RepID=UPI0011059B9E|nr:dihydroxyacetone kinase family protein [Rhizobium indicum]QKK33335.1 dihydroxyacetone kinase subunit DhaK [Rhizobium indicum]
MKKLINDPKAVVREMLEGVVTTSRHLAILRNENVVVRSDLPDKPNRKVAVISGGGAGHEPAHAGYVGMGMLAAAVVGDVFTSPSVDAVLAGIKAVAGQAGALLIVKNYTGDRLNFGLAAEIATSEGIPTEVVLVGDDVALRDTVSMERRRGIAGTVLVHKLAGAAAEAGLPLSDVARIAGKAAADIRSMGVGLGTCTVPAVGHAGFALEDNEIEYGLGIHGETGVRRTLMKSADEIVDDVLDVILSDFADASFPACALLVNGLGGTPQMELAIALRHAVGHLERRGIKVERAWCGNFMTALEMPGLSLSVLPIETSRLELLDANTDASDWPGNGAIRYPIVLADEELLAADNRPDLPPGLLSNILRSVALTVATALERAEGELADLDGKAGDGDLGASMVRGAAAIRNLPQASYATPERLLSDLGTAVRRAIAGSSGPFYAAALVRAGSHLKGIEIPDEAEWQTAFAAAIQGIADLGGAKRGDRTMLDALYPALDAWIKATSVPHNPHEAFSAAVFAASEGAAMTASMTPRAGRASYIGDRALGVPDGGASAVSVWMQAIEAAFAVSCCR